MDPRIEEILSFWFGAPSEEEERLHGEALWFEASHATDRLIRDRFGKLYKKAKAGELNDWAATSRGKLALVILLDQVPRRIYRDTPEAFATDEQALHLCWEALDEGEDKLMSIPERAFLYMPAMHAEDVDAQLASVEIYQELLADARPDQKDFCRTLLEKAEKAREVVERFERFPERNYILDRSSTSEEGAYLQQSGKL